MAAINQSSWRDRAIERSEIITDAWEVTKTYAGRLAEWVLFLCMIFCIVEILPGVSVAVWMQNTVLGVQAVMLDIGGFALSSLADQARQSGDEQAAHKADITGRFLIGIVILTLTLITIGLLYAPAKQYTDGAEKVLILVRVVMTVIYGHILHSLRRKSLAITPMQQANVDVIQELREEIERMSAHVQTLQEAHLHTAAQRIEQHAQSLTPCVESVDPRETVQSLAQSGLSRRKISEQVGVPLSTVQSWLSKSAQS